MPVPVALPPPPNLKTLAEVEREHVLRTLRLAQGVKMRAARWLGMDRRTLYRKLEAWGVRA